MIIYTGGTFDLLHAGHLELLAECRRLAGPNGRVVVSLNRDSFVERYKKRTPVQGYAMRRDVLLALRDVDAVVCNVGSEDSKPAIEVVSPDLLAIGDDWLDRDKPEPEARYFRQLGVTAEWMAELGLEVLYVPRTRGVSSSLLARRSELPTLGPRKYREGGRRIE